MRNRKSCVRSGLGHNEQGKRRVFHLNIGGEEMGKLTSFWGPDTYLSITELATSSKDWRFNRQCLLLQESTSKYGYALRDRASSVGRLPYRHLRMRLGEGQMAWLPKPRDAVQLPSGDAESFEQGVLVFTVDPITKTMILCFYGVLADALCDRKPPLGRPLVPRTETINLPGMLDMTKPAHPLDFVRKPAKKSFSHLLADLRAAKDLFNESSEAMSKEYNVLVACENDENGRLSFSIS